MDTGHGALGSRSQGLLCGRPALFIAGPITLEALSATVETEQFLTQPLLPPSPL